MLSAAQLLDELMGRDRNLAPDEKRCNVRWDHEAVSERAANQQPRFVKYSHTELCRSPNDLKNACRCVVCRAVEMAGVLCASLSGVLGSVSTLG
uniref:Uncharacterized protein n=1 Tax=Sinocyclocheilus rhinocerous TaxID=307959 RepID=A0A673FN56_9TELE